MIANDGGKMVSINRIPLGLPDEVRTKLTYRFDDTYFQNSYAVLYQGVKIKLNSIFDPEYVSGGAMPPLTSNYGTLYEKYRVNSATVYARFDNASNPASAVILAMFDPQTNIPTFPENPSTYDIDAIPKVQRSVQKFCSSSTQPGYIELKKTFHMQHMVPQNYDTSVNFAGHIGADPAAIVVGEFLILQRQGSLTADWGGIINLRVDYDVTFFGRKETEVCAYD